ncbi:MULTISPECIES: caspase family protein [unclassified Clostridium]|uniref:caspase family protein n=1 Tax=unclassified Clostridium TaxID=2614128 RepID=UPI0002986C28|nr:MULTISPECIES: caspase family protein [unclassified Clostridium]EKQ55135.1 MAG: hypothetical protein A370_02909 [Clostridium sp. Maddingley MBC34-26]
MRKALVVGFNNYPEYPLSGCVNDALKIATVLERDSDGAPNFSIKTLTDDKYPVTKSMLRSAIEDLFAGDSDVALFYFSGHGMVTSTGGTIVTPDFKSYDEGISMDDILKLANKSKVRDKIIILDCCHAGAFGNPLVDNNTSFLSEGMTVLTASRSNESAIEINGSGVFTALVVDALYGGASDLRGFVTPGSIYSYVDSALGPWEQRPVFKTNVTRFTHLRRVNPPVPLEVLRELPKYFETPESEFQLDPSFEYTHESAVEENVQVFKKLQKMFSVGLIVPCGEEYMYFAAINSKACRLTALGYHYWRLAKESRL